MTTAIVCIALLAALSFMLSFNVSRLRARATDQFPTAADDPLFVAVRAHGNAAENVATLAVLTLLVGSRDPAGWMVGASIAAVVARYVHAVGLLHAGDMAKPTPLRMVGALGTNLAGLALVAAALVVA